MFSKPYHQIIKSKERNIPAEEHLDTIAIDPSINDDTALEPSTIDLIEDSIIGTAPVVLNALQNDVTNIADMIEVDELLDKYTKLF